MCANLLNAIATRAHTHTLHCNESNEELTERMCAVLFNSTIDDEVGQKEGERVRKRRRQ